MVLQYRMLLLSLLMCLTMSPSFCVPTLKNKSSREGRFFGLFSRRGSVEEDPRVPSSATKVYTVNIRNPFGFLFSKIFRNPFLPTDVTTYESVGCSNTWPRCHRPTVIENGSRRRNKFLFFR